MTHTVDQASAIKIIHQRRELIAQIEDRQYHVRAMVKLISPEGLRLVLWLWRSDYWYRDVVDLYAAKQREDFIGNAATECHVSRELVKSDLTLLVPYIEQFRNALLTSTQAEQQQSSATRQ